MAAPSTSEAQGPVNGRSMIRFVMLAASGFLGVFLLTGVLHAGESLRQRAERGDPAAQFRIGMEYLNGRHVPKDPVKAVFWLRESASKGNSWAQVWLGLAYENGWGVPRDETKALKWWRKAAEEGNPWARDRFNGEY